MMELPVKKICLLGMFTAIGLLFGYLESLLVLPAAIYGFKIGLSNCITVILMYLFGPVEAVSVLVVRVLLSNVLFGNLGSLAYSFFGAMVSCIVMLLFKRFDIFSSIGISTIGGVMHNVAQLFVAAVMLSTRSVFLYLPYLIIAGIVAGFIVGIISNVLIKRLNSLIMKYMFEGE